MSRHCQRSKRRDGLGGGRKVRRSRATAFAAIVTSAPASSAVLLPQFAGARRGNGDNAGPACRAPSTLSAPLRGTAGARPRHLRRSAGRRGVGDRQSAPRRCLKTLAPDVALVNRTATRPYCDLIDQRLVRATNFAQRHVIEAFGAVVGGGARRDACSAIAPLARRSSAWRARCRPAALQEGHVCRRRWRRQSPVSRLQMLQHRDCVFRICPARSPAPRHESRQTACPNQRRAPGRSPSRRRSLCCDGAVRQRGELAAIQPSESRPASGADEGARVSITCNPATRRGGDIFARPTAQARAERGVWCSRASTAAARRRRPRRSRGVGGGA